MAPPAIANVFLQPSKSIIVHTTPGRDVKFFGGHATVYDHRDMPHMLAREDARVIPTEWGCSWAEDWLRNTTKINAIIEWPEGWSAEHTSRDDFVLHRPDADVAQLPLPEAGGEVLLPPMQFTDGKKVIDILFSGSAEPEPLSRDDPQPAKPGHKVNCACFGCKAIRRKEMQLAHA